MIKDSLRQIESIVDYGIRGKWVYCHDSEDGHGKYVHLDCDSVEDISSHCVMCGKPSPTIWSYP